MKKPYADFPLSPHSSGQWKKTIKGKVYYFGEDWRKALRKYEKFVSKGAPVGPTVASLIDAFLDNKKSKVDIGEIKPDSLKEYVRACQKVADEFGLSTELSTLRPAHFLSLRKSLESKMAPVTLKRYLVLIRTVFKFACDMEFVQEPLKFGETLKAPPIRILRKSKLQKTNRIFSQCEIERLLAEAKGYMKPAIWLAINCGFGNTDVCELKWSDIEGEWLELIRTKTYVTRAAYLWQETLESLEAWKLASKESEWVLCGVRGQKLGVGDSNSTPIAHEFANLAKDCGISGKGFYALRHTYRTIADGCKDQEAIRMTMGHTDASISSHYRHGVAEARLIEVSEYVRAWLRDPAGSGNGASLRGRGA